MTFFRSRVRASMVAFTLCGLAGAAPAAAQPAPESAPTRPAEASPLFTADRSRPADAPNIRSLFHNIGSDFAHLPSKSNLRAALIGSGLALTAHSVDSDVNRHLYGKGNVHRFFLPGKVIGLIPVHIGVGVIAYAVGHETDRPRVARVGLDLIEAQTVAGVLTIGLKETVRRERPDHQSKTSFPSGHAAVTFATASVLARHFGWRAAVPTYLLASYVAASRLHENLHFLSDVVAGSTVGYIAGRTVTRNTRRDTFAMIPVIERGGAGVMFAATW